MKSYGVDFVNGIGKKKKNSQKSPTTNNQEHGKQSCRNKIGRRDILYFTCMMLSFELYPFE